MLRGAQEKVIAMLTDAERQGAATREHMLRESEKEIARMAVLATEKLLRGTHQSSVTSN
jgi:F0F1-type ATP synthase membrane subunit b/b'